MGERRGRSSNLPPKTPARTAPDKTRPLQNPKRGKEGGGVGVSSPDWRMRRKGRGPRLAVRFSCRVLLRRLCARVLFRCFSESVLFSALVRFCGSVEHGASQASRCSLGSPLVGRSACDSPPRPHRESAGEPVHSQNPIRTIVCTARETRGTSWSGTTPEGLEGRSPSGTTRSGKSPPLSLFFGIV